MAIQFDQIYRCESDGTEYIVDYITQHKPSISRPTIVTMRCVKAKTKEGSKFTRQLEALEREIQNGIFKLITQ